MLKYTLKRVCIGAITLLALIVVTFLLVRLMPGNPFDIANLTPSTQEEMVRFYGLDKPLGQQLAQYLRNLLHGDLGISFKKSGTTVRELIAQEAPATMRIGGIAFIVALALGTLIGIWMAVTGREFVRGGLLTLSTFGISLPNYVLALLLMLVVGVKLKWFPVLGLGTPAHYVLPVVTLAVYPIAQISRLVKSSYTEAMQQDYVTMARAKGIAHWRVTIVHILKNAMIPVITTAGPMIAFLLTGSFVVETIFTIPGIGREFVTAVSNRDYTVVMGLTIFIGALIILCNLAADLLCALVDPRIKLTD
ncbi:MAG: ABC transporter permease [Clostridia bacterium]|nr:ABC transporter permease [Clostridia bacterium]MBQ8973048.1 ABC transporter permease [Clostridia bacterium]